MITLDGRYEAIRQMLARCETVQEADTFWQNFLEEMPEEDVENWSFRGLVEACYGADCNAGRLPIGVNLQEAANMGLREAIGTSSFPQAVTGLVAKRVLQAHDDIPKDFPLIGDMLVTTEQTKLQTEKELRYSAKPYLKLTEEEQASQSFEMGETYYEYKTAHFTREISVTEEMVMFDQTNRVWEQAKNLAMAGAMTHEKLILDTVQDIGATHIMSSGGATFRGYRPSGTATELWSASLPYGISASGNIVSSNALADWYDVQNAKLRAGNFYDDTKEGRTDQSSRGGKRIGAPLSAYLLVPEALSVTAWQIMKTPAGLNAAEGNMNPCMAGGPLHAKVLWSPLLDDNSTTTWYWGAFSRQFKLKQVYAFRLLSKDKAGSLEMMRRSIYGWVKGELYEGCAAYDNRFCIQNTA